MRFLLAAAVGAAFLAVLVVLPSGYGSSSPKPEPHRSPCDLVLLPEGRALTANHTANTVSLIDLDRGKVLAEVGCGRKPVAVAATEDGRRAAVSTLGGTICLLTIKDTNVHAAGTLAVGPLPRGLVFSADGQTLYVAVSGRDEVIGLDIHSGKTTVRWAAPREPYHLARSCDGRLVAAASSRSGQVRLWDTTTGKLIWERTIHDAFNLRGLAFAPDGQSLIVAHVVHRDNPVTRGHTEQGWVIDSRLSRLVLDPQASTPLTQTSLDSRGRAVGDPEGVAFAAGRWLAVSGSGTHELLLFDSGAVPWSGAPGDFLDPLLEPAGKLRRIPLGGRPMSVAFRKGTDTAVVANYLRDAVQVVDARAGKLVRTIPLGSPARPSVARRGEELFHDAGKSHHQWFSCHTCHPHGHTSGMTFDTLNDDSYGNPKLAPSLRLVTRTKPWTWHGWQDNLNDAVRKSFTDTMSGAEPAEDEVRAIAAFLGTLEPPPSPHPGPDRSDSAARGKEIFEHKARCARCHRGELYTSESNHDVKVGSDGGPHALWNPPTLRGLWDRGPYLHDGRAKTLQELLEFHHLPEKLGGERLTPNERDDLIAFLKSL
jgi:DNA-binding beta-propeller fold protein YncE